MLCRILCGLLLCLTSLAVADPLPQKELIQLEHRWIEAIARHDVKALNEILADDFSDTSYTGQLRSKNDMLEHLRSGKSTYQSQRLEEEKVRIFGDTAVVTGLNVVTRQNHEFVAKIRFTDVFVKRAGRWQALFAQETLVQSNK